MSEVAGHAIHDIPRGGTADNGLIIWFEVLLSDHNTFTFLLDHLKAGHFMTKLHALIGDAHNQRVAANPLESEVYEEDIEPFHVLRASSGIAQTEGQPTAVSLRFQTATKLSVSFVMSPDEANAIGNALIRHSALAGEATTQNKH